MVEVKHASTEKSSDKGAGQENRGKDGCVAVGVSFWRTWNREPLDWWDKNHKVNGVKKKI